MTSKKRTSKPTKTTVRSLQPVSPAPVQPVLAPSMTIDCFCNSTQPTSEIVVTCTTASVSVTQCVVGAVVHTVTTVKNTVKTAVTKTGSLIRSAWNWLATKAVTAAGYVKTVVTRTKAYLIEKAAQAVTITLLGCCYAVAAWYRVKTMIVSGWNRNKAKCIVLFVLAKTRAITLWNKTRIACIAVKIEVIRLWLQYQPVCLQVAKIAMVTVVLYVFANAVLLASCVIVAALGVNAYDSACLALAKKSGRKTVTAKRQSRRVPLLFNAV